MDQTAQNRQRVFTIGHSNHALEHFLELLKIHSVQTIVDARSYPYSDYCPQFDREAFKRSLTEAGFAYVDLGRELGGRPEEDEFYDAQDHVLYDKVAASALFRDGLARLQTGIAKYSIAVLCSEENPAVCHRALLVGRVLSERGFVVEHIRGDGRIQTESELVSSMKDGSDAQIALFADAEVSKWKSIPSVSRKKRQSNSLGS